jgi:hypothetical protein
MEVAMVQCNNKDEVDATLKMFMSKKYKNKFSFMPWYVYIGLEQHNKQEILNDNRLWNITFKSIVIEGHKDNNDKNKMGQKTTHPDHWTTTMNMLR